MEDEGLLDLEDDVLVKETQDTPNTFSKNLIKKLGICRNRCSGTEVVSSNNPKNSNTFQITVKIKGVKVLIICHYCFIKVGQRMYYGIQETC